MRFSELLSATTFAAGIYSACAADAPIIKDNPAGAYALANTDGTAPGSNGVLIEIVASSSGDGEGVEMTINLNGGPARQGGPFLYHIHEKPVPSSGDCTAAGAHLDPTARGESPGCDATKPETCQTGDISGKHGDCTNIPGCSKSFRDKFLSLTPGNPSFIGDKSFVLHYANKTRIACVNFSMSGSATPGGSSNSSTSGSSGSSGSSSGGTSGGASSGPSSGSSSPPPSSPPPSGSAAGPASRPTTSPAPSASGVASGLQAAGSFTAVVFAILGLTML